MKFIRAKDEGKYKKSRRLIHMKPSEFIELSLPQHPRADKYDPFYYEKKSLVNLEKRMRAGLEVDAPSFDVDVKEQTIVGHSGRHRAFIAYRLGISKIPVYMYYKTGSYYIEQLGIDVRSIKKFKPKSELMGLHLK